MRVAWATNFAAPYRRPVWLELSQDTDLTVILTENEQSADAAPRGSDWFALTPSSYRVRNLPTTTRSLAGHVATFAASGTREVAGTCDAMLLGAWEQPVYWQLLRAAKRAGARVVGFYESTLESQRHSTGLVAQARNRFFRSLDAIVTPGEAATEAVAAMGIPQNRIYTGFNAVDVTDINRQAVVERQRAGSEVAALGHRFVYVGQLIERKNVDGLLKAFAQVASGSDHLTLIGEGPLAESLKKLAHELGLDSNTTFAGAVPYARLPHVLATKHTLVLPATTEVWGLVVNEALAAGLQAVVSRTCGVAHSVTGMDGVFVSEPDRTSLANSLVRAKRGWSGWQDQPSILRYTPERFADVFRHALNGKTDSVAARD